VPAEIRARSARLGRGQLVPQRLQSLVQLSVQLAAADIEDGSGDMAELGVLIVEQGEGIAGLVDIDERDVHVANVGSVSWLAAIMRPGPLPGPGRLRACQAAA
jgi:hypothetical protein